MRAWSARPIPAGRFFSAMNHSSRLTRFERLMSLLTRVEPGEGNCVAALSLQAFALMVAFYLVRPVREALILTQGGAEFRSYAVGLQALLLILVIPAYGALARRTGSRRVYQSVNAFFVTNLAVFCVLGLAGRQLGFAFFVWASLFGVLTMAQFWAFATDLFSVQAGQRLFGVIAVGAAAGAWFGASLASALFGVLGPYGLMLAAAAAIAAAIALSANVRDRMPDSARSTPDPAQVPAVAGAPGRWLGGFAMVCRSRYLVAIAALVMLLNWITSTGDFVLSGWVADIADGIAPEDRAAWIGRFMGNYSSAVALAGFLLQLLLVSRIIQAAGVARALLVTPVAFVAGYLLVGIVPAFLLLQSVLIVHRSFDYSLLNTTRNALLLPASRAVKYEAKTAIDTFFYRLGDLLSTASVIVGTRLFDDPRAQFLWLIATLSAAMTLVAWLIGREYARRSAAADSLTDSLRRPREAGPVLAQ